MAPTTLILLITFLRYITLSDARTTPLEVNNKDNALSISRRILFHDYNFKESSDVASQLISTMMNYKVELAQLVRTFARRMTPADVPSKEECFRRVFQLPWFADMESNLAAHLVGVLTTVIEKDNDLTGQIAICGMLKKGCEDELKTKAKKEITSFGQKELQNAREIKMEYTSNIGIEMNNCWDSNLHRLNLRD